MAEILVPFVDPLGVPNFTNHLNAPWESAQKKHPENNYDVM